MPEATLLQILDAREKRAEQQKKLILAHNIPLICFTLNIAGPVKTSPLIERAFDEGISLLEECFALSIKYSEKKVAVTGCEAMFCVDMDVAEIKERCTAIENSHPLGRLFDMDVLDTNGTKLERKVLRGCIVCGKEGRECAAGRVHSADELRAITTKILNDYFLTLDFERLSNLASESLICEVYTTPKPGLVDRNNNGSHSDMNIALFEKSAIALKPYFNACLKTGYEMRERSLAETFKNLRELGIAAEETMFETTKGINTHKGAIFSLGVVCGALGRLWNAEEPKPNPNDVFSLCADLVKDEVEKDFETIDKSTAGGRYYLECGVKGIRGEAVSGFSTVKNLSLPVYLRSLKNGFSQNDAAAITLIHLISVLDDTAVYNRGGKTGADFAKQKAKALITQNEYPDLLQIEELDKEFIKTNLSPGGCADLLALTIFISKI